MLTQQDIIQAIQHCSTPELIELSQAIQSRRIALGHETVKSEGEEVIQAKRMVIEGEPFRKLGLELQEMEKALHALLNTTFDSKFQLNVKLKGTIGFPLWIKDVDAFLEKVINSQQTGMLYPDKSWFGFDKGELVLDYGGLSNDQHAYFDSILTDALDDTAMEEIMSLFPGALEKIVGLIHQAINFRRSLLAFGTSKLESAFYDNHNLLSELRKIKPK